MKCVALLLLLVCGNLAQMNGLHVVGNKIVNSNGATVTLRGVNRPGSEYSCVSTGTIFDGPIDQASIDAMKSWNINAVRVPLNEDCWLGTAGLSATVAGASYQNAIASYVTALTTNGLAVIIDLHWTSSAPGTTAAQGQSPMPNDAQSTIFWNQVAELFKNNSAVLFDIFNEPYPNGDTWDSNEAWNCWKTGESCTGFDYQPSGMQNLVDKIRATGATNIVLVGGIQHANSLSEWLTFKPSDPTGNIAASVHVYDIDFCRSRGCWDLYLHPVQAQVPLVATAIEGSDCSTDFIVDFMNYADALGIHYLAWAWVTGDCGSIGSLIQDFKGTPTNYGASLKDHLSNLAKGKTEKFSNTFSIYADHLGYHMADWSSAGAVLSLNETNVVHQGSESIRFEPTTANYLYFQCWDCIDTSLHKNIEFYVNGGATGNQNVSFVLMQIPDLSAIATGQAVSNEANVYGVASLIGGAIPANAWAKASVDLSSVPAGKYSGVRFRTNLGANQSAIYIDDITVYDLNGNGLSSTANALMTPIFFYLMILSFL